MEAGIEKVVIVAGNGADLEVQVETVEGRRAIIRAAEIGQQALLGKRYVCGYTVVKGDKTFDLAGNLPISGGGSAYAGCGTTILCTRKGDIPYCCGMQMAQQQPRKLASSN